jgi:hypothetical protein
MYAFLQIGAACLTIAVEGNVRRYSDELWQASQSMEELGDEYTHGSAAGGRGIDGGHGRGVV